MVVEEVVVVVVVEAEVVLSREREKQLSMLWAERWVLSGKRWAGDCWVFE